MKMSIKTLLVATSLLITTSAIAANVAKTKKPVQNKNYIQVAASATVQQVGNLLDVNTLGLVKKYEPYYDLKVSAHLGNFVPFVGASYSYVPKISSAYIYAGNEQNYYNLVHKWYFAGLKYALIKDRRVTIYPILQVNYEQLTRDIPAAAYVGGDYGESVAYLLLGAEMDYKINDNAAIIASGLVSKWRANTIDLNLKLNYKILSARKFQLFIAPGIRYHSEDKTTSKDLPFNFNPDNNMALSLGIVANIG